MTISAIVDSISFPSTVSGWAFVHDSHKSEVMLQAYLDGVLIQGHCDWGLQREFMDINEGRVGFILTLENAISQDMITSGRLAFWAKAEGCECFATPIWDEFLNFIKTVGILSEGCIPPNFTSERYSEMVKWIKRSNIHLSTEWYETFISSINYTGRSVPLHEPSECSNLAPILIPAGLTSGDESAVIVLGGHALLVGGNNDLKEMYAVSQDDDEARKNATKWSNLIKARSNALNGLSKYLHVTIPEKTSSLRALLDLQIPKRSALYGVLEQIMVQDQAYISTFDLLDGQLDYFRKLDTHLSPMGCLTVAAHILERFGIEEPKRPNFSQKHYALGDLSGRFFDVPAYDHYLEAPDSSFPVPTLIMSREADRPGGHIGIRRHWRNDVAPLDSKLFVSGNSFCGLGANQTNLNWWFSRFFREVFFDFNPTLDFPLLESFSPDYVLTQTVERFLSSVPKS